MKIPRVPHRWSVSPARAMRIQADLAGRVRRGGRPRNIRFVAGVDAAFTREDCVAAAVIWDLRDRSVMIVCGWVAAGLMLGAGLAVSLSGWPAWPVLLVLWCLLGAAIAGIMTPSGRLLRRSAHSRCRTRKASSRKCRRSALA